MDMAWRWGLGGGGEQHGFKARGVDSGGKKENDELEAQRRRIIPGVCVDRVHGLEIFGSAQRSRVQHCYPASRTKATLAPANPKTIFHRGQTQASDGRRGRHGR
jgi:hypothetical protein